MYCVDTCVLALRKCLPCRVIQWGSGGSLLVPRLPYVSDLHQLHIRVRTRAQISIRLYPCVAFYGFSYGGLSRPVALVYLLGKIIYSRSCLKPFLNTRKPSHTLRHMLALCNRRDFNMDSHGVFHGP